MSENEFESETKKVKLALYWGATCGGCDVATLDLNEKILELTAMVDIVFWPVAIDFKYKDIEEMDDNAIDITLFNGSIVNTENKHIGELLRKKSKVMIAFGSCSCFGGIPGLCNTATKDEIFKIAYKDTQSTENPTYVTPKTNVQIDGHELTLPEKYEIARSLNQIVPVDYYIPGCPPSVEQIIRSIEVIREFSNSGTLPPKGTFIASDKSVCDECHMVKKDMIINEIRRPHEFIPDSDRCLLEQGLICLGPATRGGCGTKCMNALMPCRGCMGPLPNVIDQGAKMISALASILGIENDDVMDQAAFNSLINEIKDPVGTFYRFTLPTSLVNRSCNERSGD